MQCSIRMKIFCRWLSLSSFSRTGSINLPRTSFPLSMKDNVAQKEVTIQKVKHSEKCSILFSPLFSIVSYYLDSLQRLTYFGYGRKGNQRRKKEREIKVSKDCKI